MKIKKKKRSIFLVCLLLTSFYLRANGIIEIMFDLSDDVVVQFLSECDNIRKTYNFSDDEWHTILPLHQEHRGLHCFALLRLEQDRLFSLFSLYLKSCTLSFDNSLLVQKIAKIVLLRTLFTKNVASKKIFFSYLLFLKQSIVLPSHFHEDFFYLLHESLTGVCRERMLCDPQDYLAIKKLLKFSGSPEPLFYPAEKLHDLVSQALAYADIQVLKICFFLKNYSGEMIIQYLKHMNKDAYIHKNMYELYLKIHYFLLSVYEVLSRSKISHDPFAVGNYFDYSASLIIISAYSHALVFEDFHSPRIKNTTQDHQQESFFREVATLLRQDTILMIDFEEEALSEDHTLFSYVLRNGSIESIDGLLRAYQKHSPQGCYQSFIRMPSGGPTPLDLLLARRLDEQAEILVQLLWATVPEQASLRRYIERGNYLAKARDNNCFLTASQIEVVLSCL